MGLSYIFRQVVQIFEIKTIDCFLHADQSMYCCTFKEEEKLQLRKMGLSDIFRCKWCKFYK